MSVKMRIVLLVAPVLAAGYFSAVLIEPVFLSSFASGSFSIVWLAAMRAWGLWS